MIVDIELTRQANDYYIARALQFPDVVIEAASREAALTQIREALVARRRAGAEIVQITIENGVASQSTWPRHAGTFPDDEAYHTMLAEIERRRRELDEDAAA